MEIIFPSALLRRVYLSPRGRPLFRHNDCFPRSMWGVPVPRYDGGDGYVWYIVGNTYLAPAAAIDALRAYAQGGAQLPAPDTSDRDPIFNELAYEPVFETLGGVLEGLERAMSKPAMLGVRKRAIRGTTRELMDKSGLKGRVPPPVLDAVATLYDIGRPAVVKALGIDTDKPAETNEYKKDPRWKHVVKATMLARTHAYQLWLKAPPGTPHLSGKFSAKDSLITYKKELLYPERCPVTGDELVYDFYTDAKDPCVARVGRLNTRSPEGVPMPYGADNVVVMSFRGLKLTEGGANPNALTPDQRACWDRWVQEHHVEPPKVKAKTTKATDIVNNAMT